MAREPLPMFVNHHVHHTPLVFMPKEEALSHFCRIDVNLFLYSAPHHKKKQRNYLMTTFQTSYEVPRRVRGHSSGSLDL